MITINNVLAEWLIQQTGARRVKGFHVGCSDNPVCPPDAPPKWHYQKGWTKWRNGSPKHYTRSESDVLVGQDWLACQFPVQYATMRLRGSTELVVNWEDIAAMDDRAKLTQLALQAARRTVALWENIQNGQWTSLDPDEDRRFYAD